MRQGVAGTVIAFGATVVDDAESQIGREWRAQGAVDPGLAAGIALRLGTEGPHQQDQIGSVLPAQSRDITEVVLMAGQRIQGLTIRAAVGVVGRLDTRQIEPHRGAAIGHGLVGQGQQLVEPCPAPGLVDAIRHQQQHVDGGLLATTGRAEKIRLDVHGAARRADLTGPNERHHGRHGRRLAHLLKRALLKSGGPDVDQPLTVVIRFQQVEPLRRADLAIEGAVRAQRQQGPGRGVDLPVGSAHPGLVAVAMRPSRIMAQIMPPIRQVQRQVTADFHVAQALDRDVDGQHRAWRIAGIAGG